MAVDAYAIVFPAHLERSVGVDANRKHIVRKHRPAKRNIDPALFEPRHTGGIDDRRHTPAVDRRAANERGAKAVVARTIAGMNRIGWIRRVGLGHHRDDPAFDGSHGQITPATRNASMSTSV